MLKCRNESYRVQKHTKLLFSWVSKTSKNSLNSFGDLGKGHHVLGGEGDFLDVHLSAFRGRFVGSFMVFQPPPWVFSQWKKYHHDPSCFFASWFFVPYLGLAPNNMLHVFLLSSLLLSAHVKGPFQQNKQTINEDFSLKEPQT